MLDKIHAASTEAGGTYQSLIVALVTSDLLRMTRTEADDE